MTVTIKLNDAVEAALRAASERAGKSVTQLVLQVLADYLARESVKPAEGATSVTSEMLKAYWDRNPDPAGAVDAFILGETSGIEDPVEGIFVEDSRSAPMV